MSRRKTHKRYKEAPPGGPKPPRPPRPLPQGQILRPSDLLLQEIVIPNESLRDECTQPSSDRTRVVPCVGQGRVINHPGTNPPLPPEFQGGNH